MTDSFYRALEDRFRGARELIKSRLQVYLPFIEPMKRIEGVRRAIDLGCGRGEWLEILAEAGFDAVGVDLDGGMLAACRERDLAVQQAEAIAYLKATPSESVAVVSGFHIAEHISFADLQSLVQEGLRVLKPAGLLILETPNPENLTVGTASFYLDPTHQRPLPPDLLAFLPEHYGFARTKILRLQEAPGLPGETTVNLEQVIGGASPDYAVVAQKACDAPELLALFDQPFSQPFGVDLTTLAKRYDQTVTDKLSEVLARVDRSIEFEARENAVRAEFAQALEVLAARDSELAQTRELLAGRESELAQARELLAARDSELTQTRALLVARNVQLQTVYSSRSWRLTEGLRSANAWRYSLGKQISRYPQTALSLLRADTVTRAAHLRLWLNNHPQAASKLRSLMARFPRLRGWIKQELLGLGRLPLGSFTVRPTLSLAGAPVGGTERQRKALAGTAADVDELMLRIEEEIARAKAGTRI